jgi:hypothetical protein
MAVARPYPAWISVARVLAFIALLLLILVAVVPGVPEWLLLIAVGLLAVAVIFG